MQVQLTTDQVFKILESAYTDYTAYQSGSVVQLPTVDATIGTTKIGLGLAFQKKAAGTATTAVPALNSPQTIIGLVGALYADFTAFEGGTAVKLPPVDAQLGPDVVEVTATIQKV